jgi:hypothetical protein
MKKNLISVFTLFAILIGQPAKASVDNSLAIQQYFGQEKCLGQGTVYKFIIPAYDISLWVKNRKKWNYDQVFALEVKARWDVCKKEMLDSTLEVMKRNTYLTDEEEKEYTEFLDSFYPDLKEEDLVTVVYIPQQKILFYHNSQLLKESGNMKFARAFCDIWLSPKTKYESARLAMLGLK